MKMSEIKYEKWAKINKKNMELKSYTIWKEESPGKHRETKRNAREEKATFYYANYIPLEWRYLILIDLILPRCQESLHFLSSSKITPYNDFWEKEKSSQKTY